MPCPVYSQCHCKFGHSSLHFFFSSRRRHTRLQGDWSSDVCSSDLALGELDIAAERTIRIDCSGIEALDLSAVWLLQRKIEEAQARGARVEIVGRVQIGRASCRERVSDRVVGGTRKMEEHG